MRPGSAQPEPKPPALRMSGVRKRYGDGTEALNGIDLEIEEGAFFGLLGPNGAGKTTLINSVAGLAQVTEGSIEIFGLDALSHGPQMLAARRLVGLAPQEINLDRFLTVRESLLYHAGYFAIARERSLARAEEMMKVFDLGGKRDARTNRLSGGMRRRVLLARALMHEPPLVILDEPTASVDVELRLDLWRYMRRLRSAGTTILLTTHYLEEAEQLCDEIALIQEGRIIARDSASGLRHRYGAESLQDAYVKALGREPSHVDVEREVRDRAATPNEGEAVDR